MSIPSVPEYAPYQYQPQPQYQQPAPKKQFNWNLAGILFAAVLVGGGFGAVLTPSKTPEACLLALDLNEEAISGLSDAMDYLADKDYTAASRSIDDVKALVPKVNAAKEKCRDSK